MNSPHDIEALRDFFIEWFDSREATAAVGPLELESLAGDMAKRFLVKSVS